MSKKQKNITASKSTPDPKIKPYVQSKPLERFVSNWRIVLLLGVVAIIVYANTIGNGYVYDDVTVIKENTIVQKGISAIPEILSTPYHRGFAVTSNDLYRPLSLVMFAIEYQFFGPTPAVNHFVNILLFAGCVILLFIFFDKLFNGKSTIAVFVTCLLFALHPIHTEVVANVKSRDELLCFFLAFLSLNVFIKYMQSGKSTQLVLGVFCFFLSLLSKETVITFLAVIPLVFFYYQNENRKRSIYIIAGVVLVAVAFLGIRYSVLTHYEANYITDIDFTDNQLSSKALSVSSRIATAIFVLGLYVKQLFVPYPLVSDYSYNSIPFTDFSNPIVLISLAGYIFFFVYGVKRLLKNDKDPYAFGLLFFIITIALFSNIPFLIGTIMGERLLFFPSLGFCLVFGFLISKVVNNNTSENVFMTLRQPKILAIIIPVCLLYSGLTMGRNSDWSDNMTLYSTDLKKSPRDCKLYFFLALELDKVKANEKDPEKVKKIMDEQMAYLRKSIAIYDGYSDSHCSLGNILYAIKQYDSSEVHEKRAIELNPVNASAFNTLGGVYFIKKDYGAAVDAYRKAINARPGYVDPYANAGLSYLYLKKYDSAAYFANKAIAVDASFNMSYMVLAYVNKATGNMEQAKKYEAVARKDNPGFKL